MTYPPNQIALAIGMSNMGLDQIYPNPEEFPSLQLKHQTFATPLAPPRSPRSRHWGGRVLRDRILS